VLLHLWMIVVGCVCLSVRTYWCDRVVSPVVVCTSRSQWLLQSLRACRWHVGDFGDMAYCSPALSSGVFRRLLPSGRTYLSTRRQWQAYSADCSRAVARICRHDDSDWLRIGDCTTRFDVLHGRFAL